MAAQKQIQDSRFSFSVNRAINSISDPEHFTVWEFVKEILILHPEYGNKTGATISKMSYAGGNKQSAEAWLEQLYQLIDISKIRDGIILGRHAILGLCRLDKDLGNFLNKEGFTQAIESEISQHFDFFLKTATNAPDTPEQNSPDSKPKAPNYEPAPRYSAGISPDAVNPNAKDLLGIEREVANFATILCSKKVSAPISIGLFGDWGSGKSFFIGKLRKEIEHLTGVFRSHEKNENKVSPDWCTHMVHVEFNYLISITCSI